MKELEAFIQRYEKERGLGKAVTLKADPPAINVVADQEEAIDAAAHAIKAGDKKEAEEALQAAGELEQGSRATLDDMALAAAKAEEVLNKGQLKRPAYQAEFPRIMDIPDPQNYGFAKSPPAGGTPYDLFLYQGDRALKKNDWDTAEKLYSAALKEAGQSEEQLRKAVERLDKIRDGQGSGR